MVAAISRNVRLDGLARRRPVRSRLPGSRAAAWPADRACRSPISSRNSVPPLASSNLPMRCCSAPVNEPFSWPKSVLSTSSRGIAATFTAMNGRSPGSPPAARGQIAVNHPRQQLLAGAALAEDQHRRRQLRHLVHDVRAARASPWLGPATNSRSPRSCTSARSVSTRRLRSWRSSACATVVRSVSGSTVLAQEVIGAELDRLDRAVEVRRRRSPGCSR